MITKTLDSIMAFVIVILLSCSATALSDAPAFDFPSQPVCVPDFSYADPLTRITLNEHDALINGQGAHWSDGTLCISESGAYLISGTLHDHSIVVDTPDDEKVLLLFNGVHLTNSKVPCLLILSASKNVTIECVEGSVNLISAALSAANDTYDAAIYSKEDLKFQGVGSLYITCTGGKGVNCRDDLSIQDFSLYVMADDDGLRGKDSVTIASGNIHIQSGADGIHSNNSESPDKGVIIIIDGQVSITAQQDGIQAHSTLTIAGGSISLKTGTGAQTAQKRSGEFNRSGFPGGGRGGKPPQGRPAATAAEDTVSTKGLKAGSSLIISAGFISADCQDDALHSDGNIEISGGEMQLSSGDDGIHAEKSLLVSGGFILIPQSYEGIESALIEISGGEIRLSSNDDGINAAGGERAATASGNRQRGFGGHGMLSATSGALRMSGGYVVVNAAGDGVDVNGDAVMSGGTLLVYGPEASMNSALDYDGTFSVSGGMLLAIGSSGMAQSVVGSENVQVMAFTCRIPADTMLHIESVDAHPLLTFASPKSYSCVIFVSEALCQGTTYNIYADGTYSVEAVDGIYSNGVYQNGTLLGSITL